MYPQDNIFKIYYNIGKRLPFQVKRSPRGLKGSRDEDYRYSQEGRTFMVEEIKIHNKIYGTAYGYCMIDGVRDDNNEYMKGHEDGEIPCAGCGEWVLIDIPGVDMNEVFPLHGPEYELPFGKYKGKTLKEIYAEDPKYVYWLAGTDRYFRVDFQSLTGIDINGTEAKEKIDAEIIRVFPKTTIDDTIPFGKYKGRTYKEIIHEDIQYIEWLLRDNMKNRIRCTYVYLRNATSHTQKREKMRKILLVMLLFPISQAVLAIDANTSQPDSIQVKEYRDSTMLKVLDELEDIHWRLSHPMTERYKLYKTENLHIMLQLDTSTGIIKILQWSLDDDNEFTVYLNDEDLTHGHPWIGEFELYPTSNMYQFILLDKILGSMWHVQWGTERSKMWIRRISF